MPEAPAGSPLALAALLDEVRTGLRDAGFTDPGREARALITALLGLAPETFLGHPETPILAPDAARVRTGLAQRLGGMPVGRIAGRRSFYDRTFELGPKTLEPRPDSEVLIEAVLEVVGAIEASQRPLRLIDVGTGSGCLLITLLAELPGATGVGVDIDAETLDVARRNAQALGVADRATFRQGDALNGLEDTFDILVSNPPYIRSDEIAALDVEVRAHDPVRALDGGVDGLDIYRRIARDVARVVPHGWLFFEVGAGMADAVRHEIDQFAVDTPLNDWRVWLDLNGHARCVAAKTLNDGRH